MREEAVALEAGLYDANGVMLCTWEESGIDVNLNYKNGNMSVDNYYQTTTTSGYYVLTNNYPETTKIVLPKGITKIGGCAFMECTSLTNITIPEGVTSIEYSAFNGCTSLTNVTIPSSVITINNSAFEYCYNAFKGELDLSNVTDMGTQVFNKCTEIESVILSDNLSSLGTTGPTFYNCSNLSKVTYKGEAYTSYTLLNAKLKENGVTFSSHSAGNPFEGTSLTE